MVWTWTKRLRKKTALGIAVQVRRDAAADAKAWPRGLNAEGFLSEVSQDGKAGRLFNGFAWPNVEEGGSVAEYVSWLLRVAIVREGRQMKDVAHLGFGGRQHTWLLLPKLHADA